MDLILMECAAILHQFNTSYSNFFENQRCDSSNSENAPDQIGASFPNFHLDNQLPQENISKTEYQSEKPDPKPSSHLGQEDLSLRIIERQDGLAASAEGGRVEGNKWTASGVNWCHNGSELTMDVIGCLPDNTQQAIKSFSIKRETEYLVLSLPFMSDILRKLSLNDETKSNRINHLTPMILCDHSLRLTSSHRAAVTLAPDFERLVLCVVQFTIYRSGTKEGLRQHYKRLLSVVSKYLPKTHLQFPHIIILDNSTNPEMIVSLCSDLWRSVSPSCHHRSHMEFRLSRLNYGVFQQCVDDTYTALSGQDRDRFLSLIKLLLSVKCSSKELTTTEKLLENNIVPSAIREFWMLWGHELLKPLIFPVAKVTWDSADHDDFEGLTWKTLFNPLVRASNQTDDYSHQKKDRKVMKRVIQEVVRRLKGQVPQVTPKEPVKLSLCRCSFCCKQAALGISSAN